MLERPKLDVILLKMTDELVKVSTDEESAVIVQNARKLVALYPEAVLVDPIDSQALTIDRESMHNFFERINALPQGVFLAIMASMCSPSSTTALACADLTCSPSLPLSISSMVATLLVFVCCLFKK